MAQLIDEEPSRTVDAGTPVSPRPASAGVHARAFCIYTSPLQAEDEVDRHLRWLASLFERNEVQLARFRERLEIDVRLSLSASTGQSSFALSADDLAMLGNIRAQLSIDIYPPE